MKPSSVSRTALDPDQQLKLHVPCVECKAALVVPLPIEKDALTYLADAHLWHLSALSEPGAKAPIVLGLLCPSCATRVYPPDVLKAAEEAREKRRLS